MRFGDCAYCGQTIQQSDMIRFLPSGTQFIHDTCSEPLADIQRLALADAWDEGAHAAWERSTPEVNGAHYRWRHEGEPRNPYREEAAQ